MEELGWMRVQAIIDERTIHFIGNIHLNHPVLPKLALKYSQEVSSDFSGRINQLFKKYKLEAACYGFIWRRGFIGPRYKTSADCYFCNASEKDTPHHLLHECKDKRCRKFQERIRTCLPDPDLYRKVEQIIGTNSEKITIPDDVTVTILDQLFELYRYSCKLRDPDSDIDDYVY